MNFVVKGAKKWSSGVNKDQVKSFLKIEEIIVCLLDGNHPATIGGEIMGQSRRELLKLWL